MQYKLDFNYRPEFRHIPSHYLKAAIPMLRDRADMLLRNVERMDNNLTSPNISWVFQTIGTPSSLLEDLLHPKAVEGHPELSTQDADTAGVVVITTH